ncbi:MAG: UDP-N-acetylmuramoyl-L-alanyl-D-glutamate--2,6-diaminopimelate ligase, partial [Butyricicoccus pullicaecorum]|nr:UDP-N-acetylmuramoyl-L-alanyl-D-glutamate--2,6-diaminopimelate ligase [Butyricicoccus pullicaecorum]
GASGVSFVAATRDEIARVSLGIPGHFSVENALAALGVCVALGVPLENAARALGTAHGVKGRAEVVPTNTDYTVLIDYAHAPDGVSNILRTVRGFAKGRVIALFGCGGDRDRTKRPIMGHLAAELSDYCIVTSDNPRTEQPEAIIEDIVAGMKDAKVPVDVICDRRAAIYHALDIAQKDDVIVLMGKGHETYQEIDHVKHHMDEREIVADYFKEKNV